MKTNKNLSHILGYAFLFQFFTSFINNVFIIPQATGISAMSPAGEVSQILEHIAGHSGIMRLSILLDMFTALGVIFLGIVLFLTLRKENETAALVGLAFYLLEGTLLAASKLDTFSLLRLSQEYVNTGQPSQLLLISQITQESMDFVGSKLANFAFCFGAVPFYTLLDRSKLIPRIITLWGLIAILPFLIAIPLGIMGVEIPFFVFLPYVPFELLVGLWISIKGIPKSVFDRA